MRRALAVLLVSLIAVVPVSAFSLTPETYLSFTDRTQLDYTAPQGKAIVEIIHILDAGETVTGSLTYGTNELTYKINYTRPNLYTSRIYLELGNQNTTIEKFDWLGLSKKIVITYSMNDNGTKYISMYYDSGELFKPGIAVPVEYPELSPIYRVLMVSNSPVNVEIGLLSYSAYSEGWTQTEKIATGNYSSDFSISNLLDFASGAYVIVSGFIWYFRLIFIDNGLLTFALFEAFVLAWSAGTSRNIWSFYRKFIRVHVALFEFLMNIIRTVIEIFYMVIQAIKPF